VRVDSVPRDSAGVSEPERHHPPGQITRVGQAVGSLIGRERAGCGSVIIGVRALGDAGQACYHPAVARAGLGQHLLVHPLVHGLDTIADHLDVQVLFAALFKTLELSNASGRGRDGTNACRAVGNVSEEVPGVASSTPEVGSCRSCNINACNHSFAIELTDNHDEIPHGLVVHVGFTDGVRAVEGPRASVCSVFKDGVIDGGIHSRGESEEVRRTVKLPRGNQNDEWILGPRAHSVARDT
jgi:hypothetical protein